jgi:hypothetical protein
MPESRDTTDSQSVPEPSLPNPTAIAVARCRDAYLKAYLAFRDSNGGPGKASTHYCEKAGGRAFRNALPQLSSRQNILAFIACIAEGVLLEEAIDGSDSGRLLYAAQVALGALPRESSQPLATISGANRKPGRPVTKPTTDA